MEDKLEIIELAEITIPSSGKSTSEESKSDNDNTEKDIINKYHKPKIELI